MGEKINVAELLKDCPKGMELDCTMYEDVKFIGVEEYDKPICIKAGDIYRYLTKFGTWTFDENAKCVIFPKGKASWEGFQRPFKDGDIVTWKENGLLVAFIYKERKNSNVVRHHFALYKGRFGTLMNEEIFIKDDELRFATEEEKEKLFQAIKDNGYKWNPETKTLEKLIVPKFKVGDMIKTIYKNFQYDIKELTDTHYTLVEVKDKFEYTEPITEDKNWELVSNKFDITTLKPFESRVLVRDRNNDEWRGQFFSHYNNCSDRPYICIGNEGLSEYKQCIPYKCNEHLLGTTDDCDEYYKTW